MAEFREQVFAGSFYPKDKSEIEKFIDGVLSSAEFNRNSITNAYSFVAPHAGYMYSGKTAAHTYKALSLSSKAKSADCIVVIGPNHTGIGMPLSISLKDWKTPLGIVRNAKEFSNEIVREAHEISIDEAAHLDEHSIEVQLPFLQRTLNKPATFICMGDQSLEASKTVANAILGAETKLGKKIVVIASSDFNHYESAEIAKEKDEELINAMEKLDYSLFNTLINEIDDSACGYGPITVAMMFAEKHGAKKGVTLKYSNSGDQTHDYSSVVAYCSEVFV